MADFGPCTGPDCTGRLTLPSERDTGLCIYCRKALYGDMYHPDVMIPALPLLMARLAALQEKKS